MEVLLNCAVDSKGRMAGPDGEPVLLSDAVDLQRVHRMRASCDAIVVGVGTILRDDPSLRVKAQYAQGPDPVRVILDTHLRTPAKARVLDERHPARIYTAALDVLPGAHCIQVPLQGERVNLEAVLADLDTHGLRRIMVEGGATVLRSFVELGAWDKWTIYQSPITLAAGPGLWGGLPTRRPKGIHVEHEEPAGDGTLWTFSRE